VLMQSEGAAQTRDVYAIHADQRGLPLAVTDDQRQVVWRQDFDAFGNVRQAPVQRAGLRGGDALEMNLRMAGQYEDAETGLYYNINRYYDPQQGRYITPDPMGLAGGEQSYAYVKGNPLAGTDPLGLFHIPTWFFLGKSPLNDFWDLDLDQGHGDIVRIAFAKYMHTKGNEGRFSQQIVDWVIRNNYHADVNGEHCYPLPYTNGGGQCNPKNHFDNPNDGPQYDSENGKLMPSYSDGAHDHWLQEALDQLNANRGFYQTMSAESGNKVNISRLLSAFGQNAHALADFYAHTNWVDSADRGGCVDNVQKGNITQEHGWIPLGAEQTTIWDEVVTDKLFSGTVAGKGAYCPTMKGDISCDDKTTHGYWDKDGEHEPAGALPYTPQDKTGWLVEKYDSSAKSGDVGNPNSAYGTGWYAVGVAKVSDLKDGDLIYRSYTIINKHQLAFNLAIEHTKQEIGKLFDGAAGISAGGKNLVDVFKMDKKTMKKNGIVYDDNFTKQ
jgi:RHS repeat-associated protein